MTEGEDFLFDYIKQHIFNEENVGLYYLSPYTVVREIEEGVYIGKADNSSGYIFENKAVMRIIDKLAKGIAEQELIRLIDNELKEEPYDWISFCIQRGLIE